MVLSDLRTKLKMQRMAANAYSETVKAKKKTAKIQPTNQQQPRVSGTHPAKPRKSKPTKLYYEPNVLSAGDKVRIFFLMVQFFVNGIGYSLIYSFFPLWAIRSGFTQSLIGVLFGSYAACKMLFNHLSPWAINKVSMKSALVFGFTLCSVSRSLLVVLYIMPAGPPFVAVAFVLRVFEAVGFGVGGVTMYEYIAELYPERQLRISSLCFNALLMGNILGPAVGGLLTTFVGTVDPFLIVGLTQLAVTLLNCALLPGVKSRQISPPTLKPYRKLLTTPVGLLSTVSTIVSSVTSGVYEVTFSLSLVAQYNLDPIYLGLSCLVYATLSAVSRLFTAFVYKKFPNFNPFIFISTGLLMVTIGFQIMGPCPWLRFLPRSLILTLVATGLLGLGHGLCVYSSFVSMNKVATKSLSLPDTLATRSSTSCLFETANAIGIVIGSVVGGVLVGSADVGFPLGIAIMSAVPSFWCLVVGLAFVALRLARRPLYQSIKEDTSEKMVLLKDLPDVKRRG